MIKEGVHPFVDIARQAVRQLGGMEANRHIVVALSGGADSVALLLVLHEIGCKVSAAHCNFNLRGEDSAHDEAFVRELCAKYGIDLSVRSFDTKAYAAANQLGIEVAARNLRYEWFEALAQTLEQETPHLKVDIAVAHHREDQLETFFLHLVRGAGVAALSGMKARNGRIIRPLLSTSRQQIEAYLAERNIEFCIDITNADTVYRRNYIRHKILPLFSVLNPAFDTILSNTMQRLAESAALMQQEVDREWQEGVSQQGEQTTIPLSLLKDKDDTWRLECGTLLYEWFSPYGFSSSQIKELLVSIQQEREGASWISETHELWLTKRHIELYCHQNFTAKTNVSLGVNPLPNGATLTLSKTDKVVVSKLLHRATIDADAIQGQLSVRYVQNGDRFCPFGMKGTKLVNDFLANLHYSRPQRERTLCLCDEKGILWVIGHRLAQRAAVTASTKVILMAEYRVENK